MFAKLLWFRFAFPSAWVSTKVQGLTCQVYQSVYIFQQVALGGVSRCIHRNCIYNLDWSFGCPCGNATNPSHSLARLPAPDALAFSCFGQVLFTNAAVVHSFLGEIDPSFVVCHDFDRLGDADQALRISEALAPNEKLREPLALSFVAAVAKRTHSPDTLEPLPHPSEDLLAARLQDKLDAFEPSICL